MTAMIAADQARPDGSAAVATAALEGSARSRSVAVLFDLDDTLVADSEATARALAATCTLATERHGVNRAELTAALWEQARRHWRLSPAFAFCRELDIGPTEGLRSDFSGADPRLAALRAWAPAYRHQTWAAALAMVGIDDATLAAELGARFVVEREACHLAFPDVLPVLATLRQTHRLGIITNGAADVQRAKVIGAGLAPFFDVVVISAEASLGKPDRRLFDLALAALAATPETAIMVGDSLTADLPGARNAGMRGIWIDRAGAGTESSPVPEPRITDLAQLLPLL